MRLTLLQSLATSQWLAEPDLRLKIVASLQCGDKGKDDDPQSRSQRNWKHHQLFREVSRFRVSVVTSFNIYDFAYPFFCCTDCTGIWYLQIRSNQILTVLPWPGRHASLFSCFSVFTANRYKTHRTSWQMRQSPNMSISSCCPAVVSYKQQWLHAGQINSSAQSTQKKRRRSSRECRRRAKLSSRLVLPCLGQLNNSCSWWCVTVKAWISH